MRPRTAATAMSIVAVTALAFAACGGGGGSSNTPTNTPRPLQTFVTPGQSVTPNATSQAAVQQLCASIAGLKNSLGSVTSVRSKSDLDSWAQQVQTNTQQVKQAAQQAGTVGGSSLQSAVDDFTTSLNNAVSSNNPITQTLSALATSIANLQTSLQQAQAENACQQGAAGTPSPAASPGG